ncbi:MAG: hypothetical protein K5686_02865 [Lachnospiraceae bacterium]|nr:hypothetical protein [Lachnospiraceae bacterium]
MKKEKRVVWFLLFVTLGGIIGRIFLWDIETSDMGVYLRWYGRAEEYGGLPGLYAIGQKIKGYNALFQLLVAALTHIPGEAIYKLKATWLFFDILLAAGVGRFVFENLKAGEEKRIEYASLSYAFCFLSMSVIFNSSAWGQSDSVYIALIIWSLVFLFRKKYFRSFLLLGTAFAFKLQTVFILPFYAFYYLYEAKFSLLYFLEVPLMFVLSVLPRQIVGLISPIRAEVSAKSAKSAITGVKFIDVYLNQILSGGKMYMEYPSFWSFLPDEDAVPGGFLDFYKFRIVAVLFAFLLLGTLIYVILEKKQKMETAGLVFTAFLLSFTTVFFLPCMIDRYGYIYEILALMLVFFDKRTLIPALALYITNYYMYAGRVGIETLPVSNRVLSFIWLMLYAVYLVIFFSDRKEKAHAGV